MLIVDESIVLIANILIFFVLFSYENEDERISNIITGKWIELDDKMKENAYSFNHLAKKFQNYISYLGLESFKNRGPLFIATIAFFFSLFTFLCYRLYLTLHFQFELSILGLIFQVVSRIVVILLILILLFQVLVKKRLKAILFAESAFVKVLVFANFGIGFSYFIYMYNGEFDLVSATIISLQISLILPTIYCFCCIILLRKIWILLSADSSNLRVTVSVFLFVLTVLFGFLFQYVLTKGIINWVFGKESLDAFVVKLKLLEQTISSSLFPILISIGLLFIWILLWLFKPFAIVLMRGLYSIQRYKVVKNKKIIIAIIALLLSSQFEIMKKFLDKIEIGI